MQNVKCRTRKKKPESILVVFCIILAWIYGKLPKIPKITKKCCDCNIHGSWLKDAFKNDQYLNFIRSFLLNWYDIIFLKNEEMIVTANAIYATA